MNKMKGLNIVILLAIFLLSSVALAQIKYPVTSDDALTVGTVVTIDGTDANKIVAADGPIPTSEVIGIITAVQNLGGVDFYLVKTEGYLEVAGATFTPGTRLTSNATGQIVASTSVKDVLVGIAVSGTRIQILINDPKIDDIFDDDITITGDLTVEGDGFFEQNLTVTDTIFAGVIDAGNISGDSIFSEYNETDVLIVNDSAYFGGAVYFEGGLESDTIRTGWLIGTQNDTIYFENYLAGPEVVIDSIEALSGGSIVIKDPTEFRDEVTFESDVTMEGDLTVEGEAQFDSIVTFGDSVHFGDDITVAGDGYFDNNIYVEDTTFTGYLDVEFDAAVGGDLQVDGEATFDSFATFNDSVYFEGPIVFGDDVEFGQGISHASRNTFIEFGVAPAQVITPLNFTPKGDVVKMVANLILSDEYSITPNYNGAKITVELYDVTNTTVLKSYTVFLQDRDWYEIKEVTISHVMSTPAVATDYTVRCYADGWGNGGRVIQGDLSIIAIQH